MTLKELSQLYWLRSEIALYEERLDRLMQTVGVGSPKYDGMPHASGSESSTERQAIRIAELRGMLETLRDRAYAESIRLTQYISGIQDSYLRVIFTHRFVHGMSWWQVAAAMGGETTADSVRKACVRYLERDSEEEQS